MATLTITIDCDTLVDPVADVSRMLQNIANRMTAADTVDLDRAVCRDINGNKVGEVSYT